MPTVLLTLGRLPKALDLARAFHAAGWRVLVAEPFRRHLTGASRTVTANFQVTAPARDPAAYLRQLADIARRESVDLVLPVSEETVHVAHLRPLLPGNIGLFTMPPDLVLSLHDKFRFIAVARAAGLAVPETHHLGSAAAADLARQGPVVVKPIFSCSGTGVRFLRPGDALPDTPGCIVQRFIPGQVVSNCAVVRQGRVVANAIYAGVLMSGTVSVGFERLPAQPAVSAWIAAFAAATNYTGFLSFDFIVTEDGAVQAIECNPRATSGLHFFKPADLVAAIVDGTGPAGWRAETRLQQFYAALTETQASLLRGRKFLRNLRALLTTRDVSWSWSDPMPFLTMTYTSWPIISEAMRRRVPMGEVAMLDVGWYAPPP